MISQLVGEIVEKQAPELVLDVNGVGYEILVPMPTLFAMPSVGEKVKLYTHFVVREDAQLLFGFGDKQQRQLFRTLIKVNGVGPKMALAILSGVDTQSLVRSVNDNDVGTLTKVPGVGKKTAERLIVELKDRLSEWQNTGDLPLMADGPQETLQSGVNQMIAEAETALVALGYKPAEAAKAVKRVQAQGNSAEDMIRLALKSMIQ